MKKTLTIFMGFIFCAISFSQEKFINYASKDSINGQSKVKGSIGVSLKMNGYFDFFGGLQDSETFNVGNINVFGTDDSGSFKVDLYQTQIKFESLVMTKKGKQVNGVVEFDFWGGNGKMRLRKAYVATDHWLIGQSWVQYGDDELWPNIMEWEGPPSGIWVRAPQLSYFNSFRNKNWKYVLSFNAPIIDYEKYGEIEPLLEEAYQTTPDFSAALKYENNWGHLRFSSILRNVNYIYDDHQNNFIGYGFSLSGIYLHNLNNFQFQLTGGKGVSAYITSVQGYGYDGYPNINNQLNATPAFGGWASYELFYTPKIHSTFVLGYTNFKLDNVNRIIFSESNDFSEFLINGNVENYHYYGIVNLMYDPIERMTIGVEVDYGNKKLSFDGSVNNQFIDDYQNRDAMRLSFGFMYAF
ncbi:hypothetical protein EC396_07025 [Lutibacter sp. HS1-25]|uniref:hypothetical protein n=1 Tax=Lutibacter sp. HS1-25 TaxID=2485000 RepID=UPI00101024DD|nr:hypothetical protein [Lutibacter sp. HS1-25]RXP57054.1 hypothetical protein EC396_07025 [Lutibacter sp. HS1-25]